MTPRSRQERVIGVACILALIALGLMTWSLFDPRPVPVIVAMSIGQAIGTLSFAAFLYVVVADIRARIATARAARSSGAPPSAQ